MRRALFLPIALWLTACGGEAEPKDEGAPDTSDPPVDVDGDGAFVDEDCDDTDATVFPGADETCDGVDDDCDGAVDEDPIDPITWWVDADGDGYGAGEPRTTCEVDDGATSFVDTDCDDADPDAYPGAPTVLDDDVDQDCDGTLEETRWATTPVAPSAAQRMWATQQTAFLDQNGDPCTASITLFVSEDAICYVGADDALRCGGNYTSADSGLAFADVGLSGVEQVEWYESRSGTMMFALAGGTLWTRGSDNRYGWLGNGTYDGVADWTAWPAERVSGFATDAVSTLCVTTEAGPGYCAGLGFTSTAAQIVAEADHVYVDYDLFAHWDSDVWRVQATYPNAMVTAEGFTPWHRGFAVGAPEHVVSGSYGSRYYVDALYWLEDDGTVHAMQGPEESYTLDGFREVDTLPATGALFLTGQALTACAVYTDGSIWCHGDQSWWNEPLGPMDVLVEAAPPGSVDTRCE